ncbi:MAG: hypothetical protein RL226_710 [Bacteroidota bacterium]|jgi:CRP-like cAMP-binding protein
MTNLKQLLERHGATFTLGEIKRGDYLFRKGQVDTSIYFIESGACRVIYESEDGENTIRFGYAGSELSALDSFLAQIPTSYSCEILKKTRYCRLLKSDFDQARAASGVIEATYLKILEQLVLQQMEREIDLLVPSPAERLQRLQRRSPSVFQHIPLKHIAAYLRMTPETLSRLRKS